LHVPNHLHEASGQPPRVEATAVQVSLVAVIVTEPGRVSRAVEQGAAAFTVFGGTGAMQSVYVQGAIRF
jgi:hypothetical protein